MKATGIVRRIDDLGRIAIPKELRRSLGIHEGDPLEIFMEDEAIVLKRYSVLEAVDRDVARVAGRAIRDLGFNNVVVYDRYNAVFISCNTMTLPRITPADVKAFSYTRALSVYNKDQGLWIRPIIIKGENQGCIIGSEANLVTGDNASRETVAAVHNIVKMLEGIAEAREEM